MADYREEIVSATHKEIRFYRVRQWGTDREYVLNPADAGIIQQLTGQKTINGRVRELLRDLTAGSIVWREVQACKPRS